MTGKFIYFDIDQTLIDSELMDEIIVKKFSQILNASESEIREMNNIYNSGLPSYHSFNFEDHCELFAQKFHGDIAKLLQVYFSDEIYLKCLPAETLMALDYLSEKYTLGIFSEGYRKFQELKLQNTGLMKYFRNENVLIFPIKTVEAALSQMQNMSILVDDSDRILLQLHTARPDIQIYQITGFNNSIPSGNFQTIKKLTDLLEILQ